MTENEKKAVNYATKYFVSTVEAYKYINYSDLVICHRHIQEYFFCGRTEFLTLLVENKILLYADLTLCLSFNILPFGDRIKILVEMRNKCKI